VSRQGSRRPSGPRTGLKRVSGGVPSSQRIHNESCKKRAKRTPGYGNLSLRHAASPSMGRSVADIPVGSRSQGKVPASRLGFQWILDFSEHCSGRTLSGVSMAQADLSIGSCPQFLPVWELRVFVHGCFCGLLLGVP